MPQESGVKFSMRQPAGAPGFPSMVFPSEAPPASPSGQPSAEDVGGIPDDVIDAFLSGDAPAQPTSEATPAGEQKPTDGRTGGDRDELQQQVHTLQGQLAQMAGYLQGILQNGGVPGSGTAKPPTFLDEARSYVREAYPDLSDESVDFLAKPMAKMAEVQEKKLMGHVARVEGSVQGLVSNMSVTDLHRTIDGWLDERKVTDKEDREEIKQLAVLRTHRDHGQTATERHLRGKFEEVVGRRLKGAQTRDDARRDKLKNENEQPPAGGQGAVGAEDVKAHILKSKKAEDDLGGTRWQRLVASVVRGG